MKKLVSIKGVIENIRQSVNAPSPPPTSSSGMGHAIRLDRELCEPLSADHIATHAPSLTLRHGFPFKPLCLSFDPVQRIIAIGTRSGRVKVLGRPGVDLELQHVSNCSVLQLHLVVNEGLLVTACSDDSINLWDLKRSNNGVSEEPEMSLKLNKDRITFTLLDQFSGATNVESLGGGGGGGGGNNASGDVRSSASSAFDPSKWLYIGTEQGRVYVLNLESFKLSGYVVYWNNCIEPLDKSNPGAVVQLAICPTDASKMLIGFVSGLIALWDLSSKRTEQRFVYHQQLFSISWHLDGRQFVSGHGDGAIVYWNLNTKEGANKEGRMSVSFPHKDKNAEKGIRQCFDPVHKVVWRVARANNEPYLVFSGGLPSDVTGTTPSITVVQGKSVTLLEMEHCVLDFVLVTDSPYPSDYQDAEAIVAMLSNDIVAIDCKAQGFPCFRNPYAMDLTESLVTCCKYIVDCPPELITALYLVGTRNTSSSVSKTSGSCQQLFSNREWPICGGQESESGCSYMELIVTGHADGSVRFWDASGSAMQSLYRLRTAKLFERVRNAQQKGEAVEEEPFAILDLVLCTKSRELVVAGNSGQVMHFKFRRKDTSSTLQLLEVPIVYEVSSGSKSETKNSSGSPSTRVHFEFPTPTPRPSLNVASQSAAYTDPVVDGFNFDRPQYEYFNALKLRSNAGQKKTAGFQTELVCLTPWVNQEPPTAIKALALNTAYGLMAYGNGSGMVVVDVVQKVCLVNMGTVDLYGASDPYQRMPKSPKPLEASTSDIVRVDLSNYTQVSHNSPTPSAENVSASAPTTTKETKRSAVDLRRLQMRTSDSVEVETSSSSLNKSNRSLSTSLDQMVTSEGVRSLHFADSFPLKNDFGASNNAATLTPTLFVGTTLGSLIAIVINLPDDDDDDDDEGNSHDAANDQDREKSEEQRAKEPPKSSTSKSGEARLNEPVVVSPSGSLLRLRGAILTTCILDCSHVHSRPSNYTWAGENVVVAPSMPTDPALINVGSQEQEHSNRSSPGSPRLDQQLCVVCTEKTAAVFALPSQRLMYSQTITESHEVLHARVINFESGGKMAAGNGEMSANKTPIPSSAPILVCYCSDGFVRVYALPSLRPLLDAHFLPPEDRVVRTLCVADLGHGVFFCTPTEVQKFSLSQNFVRKTLREMRGCVFQEGLATPEPPRPSFFKGLLGFASGPKPVDRDELFGEAAGRPGAGTATHIPGLMTAKTGSATTEVAKARMAMVERGQKLNELEDRTEAMAAEAKNYAASAHSLMVAAKNKKWYHL